MNVHSFLEMFIVGFKRIRKNVTIKVFSVFFKDTCPNVTVGVRNDSPQRLLSLSSAKRLSSQSS